MIVNPSLTASTIEVVDSTVEICESSELNLWNHTLPFKMVRLNANVVGSFLIMDYQLMQQVLPEQLLSATTSVSAILGVLGFGSANYYQLNVMLLLQHCNISVPNSMQRCLASSPSSSGESNAPLLHMVMLVGFCWNATNVAVHVTDGNVTGGSIIGGFQQDKDRFVNTTIILRGGSAAAAVQSLSSVVELRNVSLALEGFRIGNGGAAAAAATSVFWGCTSGNRIVKANIDNASQLTLTRNVFWSLPSSTVTAASRGGGGILCADNSSSGSNGGGGKSTANASTMRIGCNLICDNEDGENCERVLHADDDDWLWCKNSTNAVNVTDGSAMLQSSSIGKSRLICPSPLMAAPTVSPPNNAVIAVLAVIAVAGCSGASSGAGDLQGMLALSGGACAPNALRSQSSGAARLVLSPFYFLGDSGMVIGNVGLCALAALVQLLLVRQHQKFDSMKRTAAMAAVRAPQWSYRLWLMLHLGITKTSLALMIHSGNGDDVLLSASEDPSTAAIMVGVVGMAWNVICGALVWLAHATVLRSTQRTRDRLDDSHHDREDENETSVSSIGSSKERRGMFTKRWPRRLVAMVVPAALRWAMPAGRWKPDILRRQYGSLVAPVTDERRHWVVYMILSPTMIAVLAALPSSTAASSVWCSTMWGCSCVVAWLTAALVAVVRPHRARVMNGVQVTSFATLGVLCLVVAAGGASDSALNTLSAVQSLLALLRGVHMLFVFVMEERMDAVQQPAAIATQLEYESPQLVGSSSSISSRSNARLKRPNLLHASASSISSSIFSHRPLPPPAARNQCAIAGVQDALQELIHIIISAALQKRKERMSEKRKYAEL